MRVRRKCPRCNTNMHFDGYSHVGENPSARKPAFVFRWMKCRKCGYAEWTEESEGYV